MTYHSLIQGVRSGTSLLKRASIAMQEVTGDNLCLGDSSVG